MMQTFALINVNYPVGLGITDGIYFVPLYSKNNKMTVYEVAI